MAIDLWDCFGRDRSRCFRLFWNGIISYCYVCYLHEKKFKGFKYVKRGLEEISLRVSLILSNIFKLHQIEHLSDCSPELTACFDF